jgi:hypothetical protein
MNITVEKIFEKVGRLHMQVSAQATYIAKLEADLAAAKSAPPVSKE